MKLGLYANGRRDIPLEELLEYASGLGIEMLEIACGEESGFAHCQPAELLSDENKLNEFKNLFKKYNMKISALSCHGNPVSPNKEVAKLSDVSMRNAVLLAERLGLDTICCFSGCPGDCDDSKYPNWITVSWPMDYAEAYKWQWESVLVPYWTNFTDFARKHGVNRIALELHPGQCCYNPKTLKRLRSLAGEEIGVNLDFSHLLWQRMEPIAVINELQGCIYHMHAKDISFNEEKIKENGYITTEFFDETDNRHWNFRTLGYGHDVFFWKNIFTQLKKTGYDYVASIEIECEVLGRKQGIEKAVGLLKEAIISDVDDISWVIYMKKYKEALCQKFGLEQN